MLNLPRFKLDVTYYVFENMIEIFSFNYLSFEFWEKLIEIL